MRPETSNASLLPGQTNTQEEQNLAENSHPIALKTEVYLALLDIDGCLYPNNFDSFEPHVLAQLNKNLLLHLEDHFTKKQYQRIIFALGTNRQDFDLDFLNSTANRTCSCAFVLPFFQTYFQNYGSNHVFIEPFMMGDLFSFYNNDSARHSVEVGTTYAITLLKGETPQSHFFKSKFDEHKISLLYTHAHRAACLNPHSNITIDFYDDRIDILTTLSLFFTLHHDLLPNNVELRLHQYRYLDSINQCGAPIKGSGKCDHKYDRTVQFMSFAVQKAHAPDLFQHSKEHIHTLFLNYLRNGCALYIENTQYEESCNTMHTRLLFDKIEKNHFLILQNHITNQLNSGIKSHDYPNREGLLRNYNTIGSCDLTFREYEDILRPPLSNSSEMFCNDTESPPFNGNHFTQQGRATHLPPEIQEQRSTPGNDNDDDDDFNEHHWAKRPYTFINSDNNPIFSESASQTPHPSPNHATTNHLDDSINEESLKRNSPISASYSEENSQSTVLNAKNKTTGFFSCLFGGCCYEEDAAHSEKRMRK